MKTTTARFNSICSVCNGSVRIGQSINYGDGQGTRHANVAECNGAVALVQVGDNTMPDDGTIRRGATVCILRGPRKGVSGLVKWIGTDDRNGGTKVGIQVDGNAKLVYTFPANLTVVTAGAPVPAPVRESRAASKGPRPMTVVHIDQPLAPQLHGASLAELRAMLSQAEARVAELRTVIAEVERVEAEKAVAVPVAASASDAVLESYQTALANARAAGDQGAVTALEAAIAAMEAPAASPAPLWTPAPEKTPAPAPAVDDSPF